MASITRIGFETEFFFFIVPLKVIAIGKVYFLIITFALHKKVPRRLEKLSRKSEQNVVKINF